MTTYWYLDSVDARAGTAFASNRAADLLAEEQDLDVPSVRIAAPDFVPAVVSSRAIGFAASRSGPQLGLFLNEREVAFSSLDSLVEFIRRAYVASGGGDGGGEGGTVPPAPDFPREPDPDGKISPEEDRTEGGALRTAGLTEMFGRYRSQSQALRQAPILAYDVSQSILAETSESTQEAAPPSKYALADVSAAAISTIACELIARCPNSGDDAIVRWWDSARRLVIAMSRLELQSSVSKVAKLSDWARAGKCLFHQRVNWPFHRDADVDEMIRSGLVTPEIYASGAAIAFMAGASQYYFGLDHHISGQHFRNIIEHIYPDRYGHSDRFDDLRFWPLPVATSKRFLRKPNASVADFLALATSAPLALAGITAAEIGILTFAAMHLTCASEHISLPHIRSPLLLAMWHEELSRRSYHWLINQMPSRVFSEEIEQIFQKCVELKYA